MSTLTQSAVWFRDELAILSRAVSGAFEAISEHRQAKADAYVRPYLAKLSEKELVEMGFAAADLEKIKAARGKPLPYFL